MKTAILCLLLAVALCDFYPTTFSKCKSCLDDPEFTLVYFPAEAKAKCCKDTSEGECSEGIKATKKSPDNYSFCGVHPGCSEVIDVSSEKEFVEIKKPVVQADSICKITLDLSKLDRSDKAIIKFTEVDFDSKNLKSHMIAYTDQGKNNDDTSELDGSKNVKFTSGSAKKVDILIWSEDPTQKMSFDFMIKMTNGGMGAFLIILIVVLCLVAVGGIGFFVRRCMLKK